MASGSVLALRKAGGYSIYVLFLLLCTYLLNQLDRYALGVTSQPMAQEIHFGDKGCLPYNLTLKKDFDKFCVKSWKNSENVEKNKSA